MCAESLERVHFKWRGRYPVRLEDSVALSPEGLRELLAGNSTAAPAPRPSAAPARGLPVNKYPGNCVKCGARVAAEAGLRDKVDGKWVVLHRGDCPEVAPAPAPVAAPAASTSAVEEGDYTLITEDGHRTFNVKIDPEFADGTPVISFLSGPNNTADFTSFGFVKGTARNPRVVTWKRFREGYEDLAEDLALFLANVNRVIVLGLGNDPEDRDSLPVGTVLLAKRCRECHALLTHPDSIRLGIGPVCGGRE